MGILTIPGKHRRGNFCPLLPRGIPCFCDVLPAPCDHARVPTLLRRRLPIIHHLQQVINAIPTVMPFSAFSCVNVLPPAEMEERGERGAALRGQRTQPSQASGGRRVLQTVAQ